MTNKFPVLRFSVTKKCDKCNMMVFHIKGFINSKGEFDPDIEGTIDIDLGEKGKKFDAFKKGKSYNMIFEKAI